MRFKKPRGVLLGIGIGAFVVAAALFFLVPVICGEVFKYNGLTAFVDGIKGLFTFNFSNVLYTAIIILMVIALAGIIMFIVTLVSKKYKKQLIAWFITLIVLFGSFVFVSSYFLADVEFNGVSGKLLDSMLKTDGQMLGKILSSVALAFAILANILLVVHMFVALVAMMVTEQIEDFEQKVEAAKDKEVKALAAELAAASPVVAEKAPEAVKPVTAEELIAEATDEERKEREIRLFKECVDSGYFTEYEEIEFPDPIEGATEEPVCEASVIEEKTAVIRKSSVHVGFTHE